MIISLAKHPEAVRRRMVALIGCDSSTNSAIQQTPLPWTTVWCVGNEDALFSISSVPILSKFPGFKGYDKGSRATIARYLTEALSTMNKSSLVNPPSGAYPWATILSSEFTPRSYQIAGMERLWRRVVGARSIARGQILKDDVGLGKTVQISGVIARMIEEGLASSSRPVVVSSNPAVVGQWCGELHRFVPSLRAPGLVSHVAGERSVRSRRLAAGATVYVMHHHMFRLPQYADAVRSLFLSSSGVILDESSFFSNHESKSTIAARSLCKSAPFVIATNATPIQNKLTDTFAQMSIVDEPVLGVYSCFGPRYIELDPVYGTEVRAVNLDEFKLRLAGSWFGRRHEDVESELPSVVSEVRSVDLSKSQAAAYWAAVDGFVKNEDTGAIGLARLAAVERAAIASDFENPKSDSAKIDDLAGLLRGEIAECKVVVFSKYKSVVKYAANRLREFGPMVIHGDVSLSQRESVRKSFLAPGGSRVLIGTEAMAVGLNLQEASVVVNLDLPWNHAKLRQRVGRVARIGQKRKSVLVISYRAALPSGASTDDYFLGIVEKKRALSESVYGGDAVNEVDSAPIDVGAVREFLRSR